jgi:hypothetical protein
MLVSVHNKLNQNDGRIQNPVPMRNFSENYDLCRAGIEAVENTYDRQKKRTDDTNTTTTESREPNAQDCPGPLGENSAWRALGEPKA